MLKLRLAIISLFFATVCSVLALVVSYAGAGTLLLNFGPFTLILIAAVTFSLVLPASRYTNWYKIAILSVLAFLTLVIGPQFVLSAPVLAPNLIIVQAIILFLVVALGFWVNNCITSFESAIYELGLIDSVSNIRDEDAEESVQSMLMNSRYTGQSLGFISIDVCPLTKEKYKSELVEKMMESMATEHWQTALTRNLRKELRLIDKFYKVGNSNRLVLMCPGLSDAELATLRVRLEYAISAQSNSASTFNQVSFPDDAVTLEGVLGRLDEKSKAAVNESSTVVSIRGKARNTLNQKLAKRSFVEEPSE